MIDQYRVLKEEVAKFSNELSKRNYTIVLSKIDGYLGRKFRRRYCKFIKDIGLKLQNQMKNLKLKVIIHILFKI